MSKTAEEIYKESLARIKAKKTTTSLNDVRFGKFRQATEQKRASTQLYAEKVLIGYENPMTALQYVVFYREVDQLADTKQYIRQPEKDAEGVLVGVRHQKIFPDRNRFEQVIEQYQKDGWVEEQRKVRPE